MEFDELANRVVDCALRVLSQLGPELLELPYEQCLFPLRVLLRGEMSPLHNSVPLREAQASLFRVQNQPGILDALHDLTLFGCSRPSTNIGCYHELQTGSRSMDG